MNKKYFSIVIISFVLMVFQFLLSKELLFLRGMQLFRIVIPLVFIGYSAGSALSKIRLFKTHFNAKVLIAISSAIIVSDFILIHLLVLSKSASLGAHFFGLIWPFIFFGIYFGKVYSEAEDLKKVFLANGFGLMLGAALSGKVFRFMGWEGGILFICSVLLIFSLFFEKELKKLTLSVLFIALLAFYFNSVDPNKPAVATLSLFAPGGRSVWNENSELIRTDLIKDKDDYTIFIDGGSPTPVFHNYTGNLAGKIDQDCFANIPYVFRKYDKTLIIGTGGGSDLVSAVKAGIPNIVGIELNPVTIRLMKEKFKEYSGRIYFYPAIKIINEEGRSYAQNTKDSYDLIVLRGTDTTTTSSFISDANLASYLYTKEAIKRYWEILSDKGILFICRGGPVSIQRGSLFNMLQIYKTIEKSNFGKDIKKHICIVKTDFKSQNYIAYSILLSKSEFRKDEYDKLNSTSHQILQFPEIKGDVESLWIENSKFANMEATSDDRPSFYNFGYWQNGALSLFFLVVPLLVFTLLASLFKKNIGIKRGVFFLLLGIGYIAIEISIAERIFLFLRNPAYSIQVALASFLFFGGLGGYFGASLKKDKTRLYSLISCLAVLLYIVIFNLLYKYQPLNSQSGRIIFSFLITGPIGFLTAIPFAIALSTEKNKHIMYALDAVGTTIGTFFIFFIHIHFGFSAGFVWAAFIYFIIPFFLKND